MNLSSNVRIIPWDNIMLITVSGVHCMCTESFWICNPKLRIFRKNMSFLNSAAVYDSVSVSNQGHKDVRRQHTYSWFIFSFKAYLHVYM